MQADLKLLHQGKGITKLREDNTNYQLQLASPVQLYDLAKSFKLDINFKDNQPEQVTKLDLGSIKQPVFDVDEGFISLNYAKDMENQFNNPPIGPIARGFVCLHCNRKGPQYHTMNCKIGCDNSLVVLSEEGARFYEQNKDKLKLTESQLKEMESAFVVLKDVRRRAGQRAVAKSNCIFRNSVNLIYKHSNGKKATVKIFESGIISVLKCSNINPIKQALEKKLNNEIIETNVTSMDYSCRIIPESEIHTFMVDLKEMKRFIYFDNSTVIDNTEGQVLSQSGSKTNPYYIIKYNGLLNINCTIMQRGSIQYTISVNKNKNVSMKNFVKDFHERLLQQIIPHLQQIIKIDTTFVPSKQERNEYNTYDRKAPQASNNRQDVIERPEPYSFYGRCPENSYSFPGGIMRKDKRWEPHCYKIKKSGQFTLDFIHFVLKYGFPDQPYKTNLAEKYNIHNPDNLSAVVHQGTDIIQQRRFAGLMSYSVADLIKIVETADSIKKVNSRVYSLDGTNKLVDYNYTQKMIKDLT